MNKLQRGKLPKLGSSSLKLPKGIKGIAPIQLSLIVIVVILVALIGYFSASYFQGANTKDKLEKDKQQKELQIQRMPLKNISALKSELDEISKFLNESSPFPTSIDNVEVAYQIMQAAREAKIISGLQYSPGSTGATVVLGGNTYAVQTYNIAAANNIKNVINFLKNLEDLHEDMHMQYDTFSIEGFSLSNTSTQVDGKYSWGFSLRLKVTLQE
jgi:cytoskeletal protein RodZ